MPKSIDLIAPVSKSGADAGGDVGGVPGSNDGLPMEAPTATAKPGLTVKLLLQSSSFVTLSGAIRDILVSGECHVS